MGKGKRIIEFLKGLFKRKCTICKEKRPLRYIEGKGKICFPCFVENSMSRQEKRRLERFKNKRRK
jgi:hypothetical protein